MKLRSIFPLICLSSLGWILAALLFAPPAWSQEPTHHWSKRSGGVDDSGRAIVADEAGNVYVTGKFRGTVDFGGGPLMSTHHGFADAYFVKYDARGNHVWSKRFGDTAEDQGYAIALDGAGNVIVTGWFRGTADFGGGPLTSAGAADIFVAAYDRAGTHLWSRRLGGESSDRAFSIAVDGTGSIILSGDFRGTTDLGGGPLTSAGGEDIFVAKYDAYGEHIWSRRFGGTSTDQGVEIAVDVTGAIFVTGDFRNTVDFGGGSFTSKGFFDIFIAKYDASGNHMWSKATGSTRSDIGYGIVVDGAGNVFVTGLFRGAVRFGNTVLVSEGASNNAFIAKYGSIGNHIWSQGFGERNTLRSFGLAIAVDGAGNVLVTGGFGGTIDFGGDSFSSAGVFDDIFIARYDASGNHLWSRRFGGASSDRGYSVAGDADGSILVTGDFRDTVDFGGGPLTSGGLNNMFVAKYGDPPPKLDISPGFCPNPFPRKLLQCGVGFDPRAGAFLPVALLGSDDFNVSNVDVSTLRLEGVEPVIPAGGPKLGDIATALIRESDCDCTDDGPDGFIDLVMDFPARRIAAVVPVGESGEERVLTLTGVLMDGTPFEAKDCVIFVGSPGEGRMPANENPTLNMAFPNPFNPVTRISYTVPNTQHVRLMIYDVAGRLVEELVNEVKGAGEYVVEWNAGSLPSGIYFYRLTASNTTLTKKMVLLK